MRRPSATSKNAIKGVLLLLLVGVDASCAPSRQAAQQASDKQTLAELAADRMMKRFYETLQFKTIWDEFFVTDTALRDLEVESITFSLIKYRADALPESRISMEARERAYMALENFWATTSAALFSSGEVPRDAEYGRKYESLTRRPKPYANNAELDKEFTAVMNELNDANRKLVVPGNIGSPSYNARLKRFQETSAPDMERIRIVFAAAGLRRDTPIYLVRREMFHLFMIEEKGDFRILSILNRERG